MDKTPYLISAMDYIEMKKAITKDGYIALDGMTISQPWFKMAASTIAYVGSPADYTVKEVFKAWKGFILKNLGEDYYKFAKKLLKNLLNWDEDPDGQKVLRMLGKHGITNGDLEAFINSPSEV